MIRTTILGVALSLASSTAMALTAEPFTADATDDMESYAGGRVFLDSLFGGTVGVTGSLSTASVDEGDWFDFRSGDPVVPSSTSKFATIFGFGSILLDFTGLGGISGFSGWATAAGTGADTLSFYDLGGSLIDTFVDADGFGPGDGTMEFFSFTSDVLIGSIQWDGPETAFDDLSYAEGVAPVPLPAAGGMLLVALGGLVAAKRRRKA